MPWALGYYGTMLVRPATEADAGACLEIYRPFVEDTVITFEETVPSLGDFEKRITKALERHVWLVVEDGGEVIGYAYGSNFRERPAYRWVCETSVYLSPSGRGRGIGTGLYALLLGIFARQGFRRAYGVVTLPNPPSEAMHHKLGFSPVGTLRAAGYKHGAWLDVGIWDIALGPGSQGDPEETLPWHCVGSQWTL